MEIKEYLDKGNTQNKFRFFDQNMKCYEYYQKYAMSLIDKLKPENNPFNTKNIKQLNFNYLWDESVNAGSLENEYKDDITVNEGTIIEMYNLFYKLNTRTNTLELSKTLMPCIELRCKIYYSNSNILKREIEAEMILSDDIIRNNLAEYMAMFAIKFIISHEIGHAYNGHTKYYLETREKIKKVKDDRLFLDLQTMEMDADSFAICRVCDEIIWLLNKNDKIFSLLKNQNDIFKLLVYVIHGVFYILRDMDIINYKGKEHPPSIVREILTMAAMKEHLKKQYGMHIQNQSLAEISTEAERKISVADNKNYNEYIKYVKMFSPKINEIAEEIMENFRNNVSSKIKPESRLPIECIDY